MSVKNTLKSKLLWIISSIVIILGLAIVFVPPMINLNFLKPKIENIILSQTGIKAHIHGNVNFSMLGKTHIVAHNISVPTGIVSSCEFSIPFFDIFNLKNANISGDITIKGASVVAEKIIPIKPSNKINISNSNLKFLNKEYKIIDATFTKDKTNAIIRTDQHKYEIKYSNKNFVIKNKNNDLNLTGELFDNGTATAHIKITAQDINRWFEFDKPRITGQFPITADVYWDGGYGIKFDNIVAQNIRGSIEYQDDGYKIIKLKSDDANYDLSFFMESPEILQNTLFNLDFHGKIKFLDRTFNHVEIFTRGTTDKIIIEKIIADDILIEGGTIDANGAHDVRISGLLSGVNTKCLFNGTPEHWSCKEFFHGGSITSKFSVDNDVINADVYSTSIFADMKPFVVTIRKLASSGTVRFYYPDMDGTLHLEKDGYTVDYTRLDNRSLNQAKINLKFLPEFMKDEPGDIVWVNGVMIFTPKSKQWLLSKSTDFFILRGENFKQLTKKADLQSLNELPYVLSGVYKNGTISNVTIEIANHKLSGTLSGKSLTLKTDVLDVDAFINQSFINNFEDLSFFTTHPILLPFETNMNIALSANELIFDNQHYRNFVYSLKNNIQKFSITDSEHGNLLAKIEKNNAKYSIDIQLNKFVFNGKLLPDNMPLNLSNTVITAEIKLNTSGIIAHDIIDNINGTFDASFNGGKLYGLGLDKFYATAQDISILNVEDRLAGALQSGITDIKKMHVIGAYNNGNIKTLRPFTLSMKHVNASGVFEIIDTTMYCELKMILRGTSPTPETIDLMIDTNNKRSFSLSEIMLHFDAEYMRDFIKTHIQF